MTERPHDVLDRGRRAAALVGGARAELASMEWARANAVPWRTPEPGVRGRCDWLLMDTGGRTSKPVMFKPAPDGYSDRIRRLASKEDANAD